MAKNRTFRVRRTTSKIKSKRVVWYRSNTKTTEDDIEENEFVIRTEKYKELFRQTTIGSIETIEKLIINLLADSSTSIIRSDRSYDISYEIDNKDESYMSITLYKSCTEITIRVNEHSRIETELQYSLFDQFEQRLDNLYIEQQMMKLNSCISEFYGMTSLDRKDKIKKLLI